MHTCISFLDDLSVIRFNISVKPHLKYYPMKRNYFSPVFALIVVCTGFSACNKTNDPISGGHESNQDQLFTSKVQKNVAELRMYRQGGLLKSGEEIPVDTAVAFIDETFNFTYAYWLTPYSQLYLDSSYIEIPMASQGKVIKYCELFAAYENAVLNVREIFLSYQDSNKRIIGLEVQNLGLNPQTYKFNILLVSQIITGAGREPYSVNSSSTSTQSFSDYYYERNSYYCDLTIPIGGPCGAANIIEQNTNFVLLPYPPPAFRVYFTGPYVNLYPMAQSFPAGNPIDNFEDYYIYYANSGVVGWNTSTTCIEGEGVPDSEMDFYEKGMTDHVVPTLLNSPNINGRSFQLCTVFSDGVVGPPTIVKHEPLIKFGYKHVVRRIQEEGIYPISIE